MEALLEALQRKDFPSSQIMALGTLSSLSGHFRASRKPYMECWLLKLAGFDQPYNAMMRGQEMKTNETEFAEMVCICVVFGLLIDPFQIHSSLVIYFIPRTRVLRKKKRKQQGLGRRGWHLYFQTMRKG